MGSQEPRTTIDGGAAATDSSAKPADSLATAESGGRPGAPAAKAAILGAAVGGPAGAAIGRQMDQQAKELERDLEEGEVERFGQGILITVPAALIFGPESDVIRDDAKSDLATLARSLAQHAATRVLIAVHTDSAGGRPHNQDLSEHRAAHLAGYLASRGVPASRIATMGLADREPVASDATPSGRQANRRVEFAIHAEPAAQEGSQPSAPTHPAEPNPAAPSTPPAEGHPPAEVPRPSPEPREKGGAEAEPELASRPTLAVGVLPTDFIPDGRMNEPAWSAAPDSIANLVTIEPEEGGVPAGRTTIKVLANSNEIVIGARCYDGQPDGIVSFSKARDSELAEEDHVLVVIDTFMDNRSGYVFAVNPSGARFDGVVAARGEEVNGNWDTVWEAKTSQDGAGWCAEILIPIKSLNFKRDQTAWGFNVQRRVQRLQETSRWSGANLDYEIYQTSRAGRLTRLPDFDLGVGLNVRPAYTGRADKPRPKTDTEYAGDLSLDVTQRLGPNLSSALTVNTDFAETEVDVRQLNLTRFPLYFPEKRTFFLEDADVFEFGVGLDEDLVPFFSRRIGLLGSGEEDLAPIPISAGVRLNGRVDNTELGALMVNTKKVGALVVDETTQPFNVPRSTMGALRIKQDILAESAFGLIATLGDQRGRHSSSTVGADFTLQTSSFRGDKNLLFGFWGLLADRRDLRGDKAAYGFQVEYPNDLLDISLSSLHLGDAFDPSLGFVPRRDTHVWRFGTEYNPRPGWSWVHQMYHEFSVSLFNDRHNDRWQSYTLTIKPLDWLLKTGDRFTLSTELQGDRPSQRFELVPDVDIDRGSYEWTRYNAELRSAEKRKVSAGLTWELGNFYNGDLRTVEGRLTLKPSTLFTLEFTGERNAGRVLALKDINEPSAKKTFSEDLVGVRAQLNISPDLQFSSLTQRDTESRTLGSNNRLRWTVASLGDIFVVYNHNLQRTKGQWRFASKQSVVKLQYLWRF